MLLCFVALYSNTMTHSLNPTIPPQVVLSDGDHFVNGMLASQLNPLVHSGAIAENALVRIQESMNNSVQDRLVVILLRLSVEGPNPGHRIGDPKDVEKAPLSNSTNHASSNPIPAVKPASGPSSSQNPYSGHTTSSAPIVRSHEGTSLTTTPIDKLNMYQNKWTIQARLLSKSDVRTWSNAKGEGSLFSVELLDSSGVDIRATFFKEAVDKFYTTLQVGSVYTWSNGKLKVANLQWNTCKSPMEITFDSNAEIHLVEDKGDVPSQSYDIVPIASIEGKEANQHVDLLAVVQHVGELATIVSRKSGQELTKCDLSLVDQSQAEITLTLWGDKAKEAPVALAGTPIVAFRRAKISDYNGKSLSLSGAYQVHPDLPQVAALQAWWDQGGASQVKVLSKASGGSGSQPTFAERKPIAAIKAENMGLAERGDWLSFKGTLAFLKKDKEGGAWYTACPNAAEPCKTRVKIGPTSDGQYYCERCQGTYSSCVRRWIFSAVVEDETASTWVSFFNEQGEALLGTTADDLYEKAFANDNQDVDAYDSTFAKAAFTEWVFKCRVKNEIVNDERRTKTSVMGMYPVDYVQESKDLLAAIASH